MSTWTIRSCIVCGGGVKCEPDYPAAIRVVCPHCIAREVTDEVLGAGAYAAANEGNPDPRIRAQVALSKRRLS